MTTLTLESFLEKYELAHAVKGYTEYLQGGYKYYGIHQLEQLIDWINQERINVVAIFLEDSLSVEVGKNTVLLCKTRSGDHVALWLDEKSTLNHIFSKNRAERTHGCHSMQLACSCCVPEVFERMRSFCEQKEISRVFVRKSLGDLFVDHGDYYLE